MAKDLIDLFEKCPAFSTLNKIVRKELDGDTYYAIFCIYGILFNLYPDAETNKKLMHEYLKYNFKKYDFKTTEYYLDKIDINKLKPISCNKLILKKICSEKCSSSINTPLSLMKLKIRKVVISFNTKDILAFLNKYKLNVSDIKVIITLLNHCNGKDNTVYPSIETIASIARIDKRTVSTTITKLEKLKLINIIKHKKQKGYANNIYEIFQEVIDVFNPQLSKNI